MALAPLAGALLMLAACASGPSLIIDSAEGPFPCSTLAWLESTDKPTSIMEQRLRSEVMKQLVERGYTEVPDEAADCQVAGGLFTGSKPGSAASVGIGAGNWGGSFGTSIGVSLPVGGRTRTVSHLVIAIIERERNMEVWRGTLDSAFQTTEPTSVQIAQAVRTVLESFPRAN